jgi:hypothetical protein
MPRLNFLGVKPIPSDPFAPDRDRIERASDLVELFQETVAHFSGKIDRLSHVNDELFACLPSELSDSVHSLRDAHARSQIPLRELINECDQFASDVQRTRTILTERDEKYWTKLHYEDKISKLSEADKLNSEFMDRNVKKRSNAITEFAETEKNLKDAQVLARSIPTVVDTLVTQYCRYLDDFCLHASMKRDETTTPICENCYPRLSSHD